MSDLHERVRDEQEAILVSQVMIVPGRSRKHVDFITSSWLNSHWQANREMRKETYMGFHHKVLEELLPRSDVRVMVSRDDPDSFVGYSVGEQRGSALVVHWVYVKQPFRHLGLGKALLEDLKERHLGTDRIVYTHWSRAHYTKSSRGYLKDYCRAQGYEYVPYYLWATMPEGWAS